jgi:hypothetical protein
MQGPSWSVGKDWGGKRGEYQAGNVPFMAFIIFFSVCGSFAKACATRRTAPAATTSHIPTKTLSKTTHFSGETDDITRSSPLDHPISLHAIIAVCWVNLS